MAQSSGRDAPRDRDGSGRRFVEPIRRAGERVRVEREEVVTEIEALEAFDSHLDAIEIEAPLAPAEMRLQRMSRFTDDPGPSAAIARVREAYRETVMSVPHYDRVYGESLEENLASELGPALAAMLDSDGPGTFTRGRRDALRSAVSSVLHQRHHLVEMLDREAESLDCAAAACSPVAARVAHPGPHDPSVLAEYIDRIDAVTADRLDHFTSVVERQLCSRGTFCAYLYGDKPWTFPVLYAAATLRDRIEQARFKP